MKEPMALLFSLLFAAADSRDIPAAQIISQRMRAGALFSNPSATASRRGSKGPADVTNGETRCGFCPCCPHVPLCRVFQTGVAALHP